MTEADVAALVEGLAPVTHEAMTRATAALVQRQITLEAQVQQLVEAAKDAPALRERLAALEARPPVPGPPGPPGRDGADGLGLEDLAVTQHDDRSFTIAAVHGERVKEIGTARFAVVLYRGVWTEGRSYDPGDSVTWAGSEWHCVTATTTKPGEGSKAWTLKVKRGRDGKDGKDGPSGPPGPAGRDWQQVYDDTRRR
jgi:hypothetical protein